ncbi:RNA polymerase sigma factor [Risungbinella massiliensis]|uniref:RNA polymerase sigma factor n=1 Tax=Risungbinella massiliensis TaxID=1329796 RepID=UPI0005CBFEE5|nr:RNA polymerase sigma factor [Risungbinella massiliensis]
MKIKKKPKPNTNEFDAFREILQTHQTTIFQFVYRMVGNRADAEDLTQEIFWKAYRKLDTFEEDSSLSTWIHRIASNTCLDHLRKKQHQTEYVDDWELLEYRINLPPVKNTLDIVIQQENLEQVQVSLAKLPEKQRLVFLLYYQQDLSYREIAEILQIPLKTVGTYLHRSRSQLRTSLETIWKEEF